LSSFLFLSLCPLGFGLLFYDVECWGFICLSVGMVLVLFGCRGGVLERCGGLSRMCLLCKPKKSLVLVPFVLFCLVFLFVTVSFFFPMMVAGGPAWWLLGGFVFPGRTRFFVSYSGSF